MYPLWNLKFQAPAVRNGSFRDECIRRIPEWESDLHADQSGDGQNAASCGRAIGFYAENVWQGEDYDSCKGRA